MKLNMSRNIAALVLLVAVALIGSIVLVALGKTAPEYVSFVIVTGIGAIAGVAMPSSVSDTIDQLHTVATTPAAPVVMTVPPAAPLPAATPVTDPPAAP